MRNIKWIGIIDEKEIEKYQKGKKVQFYVDDTYYI